MRKLALARPEEVKGEKSKHLYEYNMSKVKKIEITNIEDNTKTVFESIRKAAVSLNSNHTTLREYIKSGKLFKGRAACGSDQLALG
jgi:hypothetical protein